MVCAKRRYINLVVSLGADQQMSKNPVNSIGGSCYYTVKHYKLLKCGGHHLQLRKQNTRRDESFIFLLNDEYKNS